jgi:putative spermidine/putrescine transport system substrate-binding protein
MEGVVKSIPRVLAGTACCAALVAAAGCGSSSDSSSSDTGASGSTAASTTSTNSSGLPDLKGQKITLANYGGVTSDNEKKAWLDPFAQATGAQVATDNPVDPAKVKVQVQTDNVKWDVVDIDGATGAAGCGTLYKKRSEMNVDISKVDPKYVSDDCGVPILLQVQALMYNKDKYKDNPPTKIQDFLDTKNFPGKRALFNYAIGGFEPLLQASGVPPAQLYPYNYDTAQQAYNKIKGDIVLQNELAQQGEQLSSGNFDLCVCYNGRAAITPNVDPAKVGIVWDGAWVAYDVMYAVKGSKNDKAQAAFLNYVAKPETQNAFTELQPYEPTTNGPAPNVPEGFKYWMLAFNKDKLTNGSFVNYKELGKPGVADEAIQKWTAMTSG